jgi:hypothetical protein
VDDIWGGSRISSLGGARLKKLRRAEGGAKIFGVFRKKGSNTLPARKVFFSFHKNIYREISIMCLVISIFIQGFYKLGKGN